MSTKADHSKMDKATHFGNKSLADKIGVKKSCITKNISNNTECDTLSPSNLKESTSELARSSLLFDQGIAPSNCSDISTLVVDSIYSLSSKKAKKSEPIIRNSQIHSDELKSHHQSTKII